MEWNDLKVREAKMEDAHAICSIYNQHLGEATLDIQPLSPDYYTQFLSTKSELEKLYILCSKDQIIAFSQIKKYSPKKGYQFTCETSTFFEKAYIGRGFGSKLKQFIIEECGKLGYQHIVARIMAANKVSIDYNLKLGYEIVGVQKKVGFVDGQWHDVVMMQYLFDQNP